MDARLEQLAARVALAEPGAAEQLAVLLRSSDFGALEALSQLASARVRQVAAAVLPGRIESAAPGLARKLARDREVGVRRALAASLADDPFWGDDELYATLLEDADEEVRGSLVEAALGREALLDTLAIALLEDESPALRARLCALFAQRFPERALPLLVEAIAHDADDDVERAAAVALSELIKDGDGLPEVVALPSADVTRDAIEVLKRRAPRKFARAIGELQRRLPGTLPQATPPTTAAHEVPGERAFEVETTLEALLAVLRRPRGRAALLVGESGVGKSALVHELARRELRPGVKPRIVRMAPAEFLAGTKYLGEWESKLDELVRSLQADPRAVLYIPSAHDLATVGTTVHSTNNVASALAPHIESGALTVIGETTPRELAAGLGKHASLRRPWTEITLLPADDARTRRILRAICDAEGVEASDAVLERVVELSEMFVGADAQPGRSAGLLRSVLAQHKGAPLGLPAVLGELARLTGVPLDLLDDDAPLDTARLREFFGTRVMGQRDAIESVVDLVTLFKAGLNDPNKPLAVLLFVGPTGVGKTELARALAERLFGDPARLVRFDMSEYATYEAFERLHGSAQRQGALTNAVRERPLSVVLLDEIEKAHSNVFDLCLQIFDAGRLTDGSGRTVDFRRAIVIMTSNLGSAVRVDPRLGFGAGGTGAPANEDVQRELRAFFRPEFLARIDRIVHFEPLSLESADQIARRELGRMLQRRGIERRGLSIDFDPALVSLLLREGYTQAFGARPLKRTIERRVLLPVARTIASSHIEAGAVLRLRASGGGEVLVDVVRPSSDAGEAPRETAPASAEALRERSADLLARLERIETASKAWCERRSELVEISNAAAFWERPHEAERVRDELHRVDQLLERVEKLARAARSAAETSRRPRGPKAIAEHAERVAVLAAKARVLERLSAASNAAALADAVLEITSVRRTQDGLDGVALLARMYLAWAKRHGLECETLSDRRGGEPHEDSLVLAVRGAGAHELLRGESGLHTLQQTTATSRGRRAPRILREAVRVDVHAAAEHLASEPREGLSSSTRKLDDAKGREIARPTLEARVFDSARASSASVWTSAPRDTALAHARLLLESRGGQPPPTGDHVVRRYQLGPSPLVKDTRSKSQTGKLHRVLDGEIDEFLALG
jgi:ATP-dependent Clp protease ATP-binding subunit ClpC